MLRFHQQTMMSYLETWMVRHEEQLQRLADWHEGQRQSIVSDATEVKPTTNRTAHTYVQQYPSGSAIHAQPLPVAIAEGSSSQRVVPTRRAATTSFLEMPQSIGPAVQFSSGTGGASGGLAMTAELSGPGGGSDHPEPLAPAHSVHKGNRHSRHSWTKNNKTQSFGTSTAGMSAYQEGMNASERSAELMWIGYWIADALKPESEGATGRIYRSVMMGLIGVSAIFAFAEAISQRLWREPAVYTVEIVLEIIFVFELIARLYLYSFQKGFMAFIANSYNLVDVLTILPLGLRPLLQCTPWTDEATEQCSMLLAAVPALRLAKVVRHMTKLHLLWKAFERVFDALPAFVFFHLCIFFTFSGALFVLEPRSNIPSYSEACWLTVVSMTTLGYGDMYPVSTLGRISVGMLMFVSILYTGIPIGIIGSAFTEVWNDRDRILLLKHTKSKLRERGYTPKDIPRLFNEFDLDCDGGLSFTEFTIMLKSMKLGFNRKRVGALFRNFDKKNTGLIDDKMFVRAVFPDSYDTIFRRPVTRVAEAEEGVFRQVRSWTSRTPGFFKTSFIYH